MNTAVANNIQNPLDSVAFIRKQDGSITVFIGGKAKVISTTHHDYARISDMVDNPVNSVSFVDELKKLTNTVEAITEFTEGEFEIVNGEFLYKGTKVDDYTSDLVVDFYRKGHNFKPVLAFFQRLMANPSQRARDELFKFLRKAGLPICDDGFFIAYKAVRKDFYDIHSGTVKYVPGTVVTMPREAVDDDRDRTCSTGLHFASAEYGFGYEGRDIKLAVKIDPADVVSIPSDYNDSKGRACRIYPLAVIEWDESLEGDYWQRFKDADEPENDDYEEDDYEEDDYDLLDSSDDFEDEDDYEDEDECEVCGGVPDSCCDGPNIDASPITSYELQEYHRHGMTVEFADRIRAFFSAGVDVPTKVKFSEMLGISPRQLGRILNRERWA